MTCDIDINPDECDVMLERKKLLNIEMNNLKIQQHWKKQIKSYSRTKFYTNDK